MPASATNRSRHEAQYAQWAHSMLDQFERHAQEIPARIDACTTEAEAVTVIKQWLCDDLDYDLIVEAWERKAGQQQKG